jgi:hypothetical protein
LKKYEERLTEMTDHLSCLFLFFREEVLRNALARLDTSHQQEEEEKEREVAIALRHLARSLLYFIVYTATLLGCCAPKPPDREIFGFSGPHPLFFLFSI